MEQHWILLDLADSSEGITQTVVSSRRIFEISFTSQVYVCRSEEAQQNY